MESVKQTANDLIREANAADAAALRTQLNEVDSLWNRVNKLSDRKSNRLKDALKEVRNNMCMFVLSTKPIKGKGNQEKLPV